MDGLSVFVKAFDHLWRERIKPHIDEREVRDWLGVYPHKNLLELLHCFLVVAVKLLQLRHVVVL